MTWEELWEGTTPELEHEAEHGSHTGGAIFEAAARLRDTILGLTRVSDSGAVVDPKPSAPTTPTASSPLTFGSTKMRRVLIVGVVLVGGLLLARYVA